jgi:cytochrome c551/c552
MSARTFRRTLPVLAAAVLTLGLGAACKKEEPTAAPGPEVARGGPPKAPASPGEALFAQKGCVRCHSIGEATAGGPKGKRMGPDLSTVGADTAHTPEWLATYVRDPHGQNPGSKMPKHDETKISEQEMETLVKYLSSLK